MARCRRYAFIGSSDSRSIASAQCLAFSRAARARSKSSLGICMEHSRFAVNHRRERDRSLSHRRLPLGPFVGDAKLMPLRENSSANVTQVNYVSFEGVSPISGAFAVLAASPVQRSTMEVFTSLQTGQA